MTVCSPELGIGPEATLGGAVYDRELLMALASNDVDITILLPGGEPVPDGQSWTVVRTPRHRRSYYEYNWIFYRALVQEFERRRFDILRVHSPYSIGLGALWFARRARVPTVLHYLHVEPRSLWRAIDRMTLGRYAHIITISEATRRELLATYSLDPGRVSVALPGVASRYSPGGADPALRARWAGAHVALFLGSLIPRKNVSLAIDAVAVLRSRGDNVRLVIAGTGPEEASLRTHAINCGIGDHVDFVGRVTEQSKVALLRSADVFVFPSTLEGFGMAAVEAMACGTPVVALDSGPVTEFLENGVSGLGVDPSSGVHGFADAIGVALHDEDLRADLKAGGRRRAEGLTWDRSAKEVARVYREVCHAA